MCLNKQNCGNITAPLLMETIKKTNKTCFVQTRFGEFSLTLYHGTIISRLNSNESIVIWPCNPTKLRQS